MKNALALLLPFCLAGLPVQAQTSGSAEAAKGKISMCIGCHGFPMYKSVFPEVYSVPMIAGQPRQSFFVFSRNSHRSLIAHRGQSGLRALHT